MSSLLKCGLLIFFISIAAFAQPSIGGVVNAASYAQAPLDANGNLIGNNLIAQGAIFVIFGKNMGPATLVSASGLPLQTTIPDASGTSVSISSGGKTVSANMVYSSAGQEIGRAHV